MPGHLSVKSVVFSRLPPPADDRAHAPTTNNQHPRSEIDTLPGML